jgi:two-component system, cell cycle response regulator DivK
MDGMEVLKNIKEDTALSQMPVVAVTAHAMQGDEQKFIGAGCMGYISKPIDVTTFLGTVQSFINKGA